MDLASLSFSIDSSQAATAVSDLNRLRGASVDATASAARLTQAFLDGKDPLQAYRSEMALLDSTLATAGRGIDGLVAKVQTLSQAFSGFAGPTAELRVALGQLEAAGLAFGTTARGIEMFVRTSRDIGLSSTEMTSSLQRVEAALRGVTAEGQRAREVLANVGVNLNGRGPDQAADVLRDFTERMRRFRPDAATGEDYRAVLGDVSIATIAGLQSPAYRTIAQIQQQRENDAMSARAVQVRNWAVQRGQQSNRWDEEYADLQNEYSASYRRDGMFGWNPGDMAWLRDTTDSFFQTRAQRRAELERRRDSGQQSYSDWDRSQNMRQGFLAPYTNPNGPMMRWLNSAEYAANVDEIGARRREELQDSWMPLLNEANFNALERYIRNRQGPTAYVPRPPTDTRETLDRTQGFTDESVRLSFLGGMSPLEQRTRRTLLDAVGDFGTVIPNITNLSEDEILSRLTPAQREAVQRRWSAADIGFMREAERRRDTERDTQGLMRYGTGALFSGQGEWGGASGREEQRQRIFSGITVPGQTPSFAGYETGGVAALERAQEFARIMAEAVNTLKNPVDQRNYITNQMAAAEDRWADQTRLRSLRMSEGADIGLSAAGAAADGNGALSRLFRIAYQASMPGASTVDAMLWNDFGQAAGTVGAGLGQRWNTIESGRAQANALRSGSNPTQAADEAQIDAQLRSMREIRDLLQDGTEKRRQANAEIEKMEQNLRRVQEEERKVRTEVETQLSMRQTASNRAEAGRIGPMSGVQRYEDQQMLSRFMRITNITDVQQAREAMANPAYAQQVQAARQEMNSQVALNSATMAGDRSAQLMMAETGGTGNPRLDLILRRQAEDYALLQRRLDPDELRFQQDLLSRQRNTQDDAMRNDITQQAQWRAGEAGIRLGYMTGFTPDFSLGGAGPGGYAAARIGSMRVPTLGAGWGQYADQVNDAAARYGVDPALMWRIANIENPGGSPGAVSPTGVRGLFQTEQRLARSYGYNTTNPNDPNYYTRPENNIQIAGRYLGDLTRRFGSDEEAIALAYSRGAGGSGAWRRSRDPSDLDGEGQVYLARYRTLAGSADGGAPAEVREIAAGAARTVATAVGTVADASSGAARSRAVPLSGVPTEQLMEAAYGVRGDINARAWRQAQTTGGNQDQFALAEAMARAAEATVQFTQAMARGAIAIRDIQNMTGMTNYQRQQYEAVASVRGQTEGWRSTARELEARGETVKAEELRRMAREMEDQQGQQVRTRADMRVSDRYRDMGYEIEDLRVGTGFGSLFRTNQGIQRDMAEARYARSLRDNDGLEPGSDRFNSQMDRFRQLSNLQDVYRQNQQIRDSFLQIGDAAGQALGQIVLRGGNAKEVLSQLAAQMASILFRLAFMQSFNGLFGGSSGGGGGGESGGGLFGMIGTGIRWVGGLLSGGAAPTAGAQGMVIPHAQGGAGALISYPTYFPMANGGTGLAGEAGTEAVFPLSRDSSGRLGIRTNGGGGGVNITNNIVMQGSSGDKGMDQQHAERMSKEIRRQMEGLVAARIREELRPGGIVHTGGWGPVYN